jgi:signal transduction histidine kinase
MTLFFALVSWRSYLDRDRSMARLRPFVASQRLYERLLRPTPDLTATPAEDAATPFRALCNEILGASRAALLPLGPLAPLVPPLTYVDGGQSTDERSAGRDTASELSSAVVGLSSLEPHALCLPLDPAVHVGMSWAVPLWSERGLIGALLLGPKREGALYTQEEIELARAAGERLVDAAAGAEMARRLMHLQRRRLAESQVVDRRTRRVLHDDVLPHIHELMLTLQVAASPAATTASSPPGERAPSTGAAPPELGQAIEALAALHRQIADLLHAMPPGAVPEVARLGLLPALRHALGHEFAGAFERVSWDITTAAEGAALRLEPLAAEVAFYALREAVRNAARHGRGVDDSRPLHLTVGGRTGPGSLRLFIEDDGVGMGAAPQPGGSGHGLELHSTLLAVVGGTLAIESAPASFTRVSLSLVLPE